MRLEFLPQGLQGNVDLPKTLPEESAPVESSSAVVSKEMEMPKVQLSDIDKEMWRDAAASQLMLDDPLAYESFIIDEQRARDGLLNEPNSGSKQVIF